MDNIIGRVVAVAGSQMTATLEVDALTEDPVRIGAMVKVRSAHLDVIGTIGTINAEGGGSASRSLIVVDLLGEIVPMVEGRRQFNRGVTLYPVAGTPVRAAMDADLNAVYTRPSVTNVSIGTSTMTRGARPLSWSTNCWRRISRCSGPPAPGSHAQ
jgi:hypothetical protein